jgi:Tol biopolymer transport system component
VAVRLRAVAALAILAVAISGCWWGSGSEPTPVPRVPEVPGGSQPPGPTIGIATPKPTLAPTGPFYPIPTATPTPVHTPAPGGQYVLFRHEIGVSSGVDQVDVWVTRADGTGARSVSPGVDVPVSNGPRYTVSAAWSDNGAAVHFVRWQDVAGQSCLPQLVDLPIEGHDFVFVNASLTNGDVAFVWSFDDSLIAFEHWSSNQCYVAANVSPAHDVVVMNADGTGRRTVAASSTYLVKGWLPDGSALIAADRSSGLMVRLDVATGSTSPLVPGRTTRDAAVSPDGSRIAYIDPSTLRLHVAGADGSGDVDLGATTAIDSGPVWSPDGASVAIGRRAGLGGPPAPHATVVSATTGSARALPNGAVPLFWSSDGSRLVCRSPASGGADQYMVVNLATSVVTPFFYGVPLAWQPLP